MNRPVWGVSIAGDFQAYETIYNGIGIWYRDEAYQFSARADFMNYFDMELSGFNRFQFDGRYYFNYENKFRPFAGLSVEFFRKKAETSGYDTYRVMRPNGYCYPDGLNYDDYTVWRDRTEKWSNINVSFQGGITYRLTRRLLFTALAKAGVNEGGYSKLDFFHYEYGRYETYGIPVKKLSFGGEFIIEYQLRIRYRCKTPYH